jgi:hypothetical protein
VTTAAVSHDHILYCTPTLTKQGNRSNNQRRELMVIIITVELVTTYPLYPSGCVWVR